MGLSPANQSRPISPEGKVFLSPPDPHYIVYCGESEVRAKNRMGGQDNLLSGPRSGERPPIEPAAVGNWVFRLASCGFTARTTSCPGHPNRLELSRELVTHHTRCSPVEGPIPSRIGNLFYLLSANSLKRLPGPIPTGNGGHDRRPRHPLIGMVSGPMPTVSGFAVGTGGEGWATIWRGCPGSVSPGRGSGPMRPSWRTATSGRADLERRGTPRQEARLPQADRAVVGLREWRWRAAAWDRHSSPRTRSPRRRRPSGSGAPPGAGRGLADLPGGRARLEQMLALPLETPAVARPEPAGGPPAAPPVAVATPGTRPRPASSAGRRGGAT